MKSRLFAPLAALAVVFAMTTAEAFGGPPIHVVHGQGIVQLDAPDGIIVTVSILAWEDETGVHGIATWLNEYPSNGWINGWQWVIDIDTLTMVAPNKAHVGGVIVQDNRFPWNEGARITIRGVEDNGQGDLDPPDRIFGVPIRGGNFIVR